MSAKYRSGSGEEWSMDDKIKYLGQLHCPMVDASSAYLDEVVSVLRSVSSAPNTVKGNATDRK